MKKKEMHRANFTVVVMQSRDGMVIDLDSNAVCMGASGIFYSIFYTSFSINSSCVRWEERKGKDRKGRLFNMSTDRRTNGRKITI